MPVSIKWNCRACNRPLRDPESLRLGIGPVCRAKGAGQLGLFGGERAAAGERHAHYDVVKMDPPAAVWIRDRVEDGVISVTNDAEHVVRELVARFGNVRVFYLDSMSNWDELKHDGGTFTGFAPARDTAPKGVA